jgi:hypothetical protein
VDRQDSRDSPFTQIAEHEADADKVEANRLEALREVDDLKFIMGHKQGRRYVWRQLEGYGVFRTVFNTDSLLMAFNEGARNQGLRLIAELHRHTPERYAEMIKENKEYGRSNRNTSDRSR